MPAMIAASQTTCAFKSTIRCEASRPRHAPRTAPLRNVFVDAGKLTAAAGAALLLSGQPSFAANPVDSAKQAVQGGVEAVQDALPSGGPSLPGAPDVRGAAKKVQQSVPTKEDFQKVNPDADLASLGYKGANRVNKGAENGGIAVAGASILALVLAANAGIGAGGYEGAAFNVPRGGDVRRTANQIGSQAQRAADRAARTVQRKTPRL